MLGQRVVPTFNKHYFSTMQTHIGLTVSDSSEVNTGPTRMGVNEGVPKAVINVNDNEVTNGRRTATGISSTPRSNRQS